MINLKTEIIYFNCTTDFQFEFNLNTAVQMRLFTECPANDKAFLGALSLAVSRSRAIIITSKFDEKLLTKLAAAIGFKTDSIDPAEYGISKMETDKLIVGGVPLVTKDGVYAGIILESGPQSLIIITNERAIRKQLMSELVHPYLNDVAYATDNNSPVISKVETDTTDDVVTNDTVDEVVHDESGDDVDDYADEFAADNVFSDSINTDSTANADTDIDANDNRDENNWGLYLGDEPDEDEAQETTVPKQKRTANIFTAILAVILFLLVAFIVYSLIIDPFLNNISIEENLKHIFGFLFE